MSGIGYDTYTLAFHERIHVFMTVSDIWILVVSDIVNIPPVKECLIDDPRCFWYNFVDPSAVSGCF